MVKKNHGISLCEGHVYGVRSGRFRYLYEGELAIVVFWHGRNAALRVGENSGRNMGGQVCRCRVLNIEVLFDHGGRFR